MESPVLQVRGLRISLRTAHGAATPVDGVDLELAAGETLGLVGESGCGKTLTALALMRLLPGVAKIDAGAIHFAGYDLASAKESVLRRVRGGQMGMVFQEPMTSLNPVFRVGDQIGEALRAHRGLDRNEVREATLELLRLVEIPSPEDRIDSYPHEMSGGQRQRVMIAMAIACRPKLLVADEPTTALDVTIQAQILDLLDDLRRRFSMALLLVTHDLGVVAQHADRIAVMYAGRIVEQGDVPQVFAQPRHPYTNALLAALPRPGSRGSELRSIAGSVPELTAMPQGCRFHPRCPRAVDRCRAEPPRLEASGGHAVACFRPHPDAGSDA